MRVDLLGGSRLVQGDELVQKEVTSLVVRVSSIVNEVVSERRVCQLFLEEIDLVEEENDRRLDEPARVADGVKESECLCTINQSLTGGKRLAMGVPCIRFTDSSSYSI